MNGEQGRGDWAEVKTEGSLCDPVLFGHEWQVLGCLFLAPELPVSCLPHVTAGNASANSLLQSLPA